MSGTKRGRHGIVLKDYMAEKRDQGAIDITLSTGEVLTVDPPDLWSDAAGDAMQNERLVEFAGLVLGGEDQFAKLTADGGSALMLLRLIESYHGETGKSSASSAS